MPPTRRRLPRSFYLDNDVVLLARKLLGKYLVTQIHGVKAAGRITETEAYRAPDDKACHAYQNRRTKRTEVMFAQGGTAYVYLCYGIHHLFNVVTGPAETAHAVLIRAVEPTDNIDAMLERRGFSKPKKQLTAGPGVLSKALGITTAYTGIDLCAPDSPIWIENRDLRLPDKQIVAGPRVGIDYAEECKDWPWRFQIGSEE